jgi:TolA-binding protein
MAQKLCPIGLGKLLAFAFLACGTALLLAQDESAADVLAKAQQAQAAGKHGEAVSHFRDFLKRFADHPDSPAARLGLAVSLIDGPDQDFADSRAQLQALNRNRDFAERPPVLLYLGLAARGLGLADLLSTDAQRRQSADKHLTEAVKHFAAAADRFAALVKAPVSDGAPLPADLESAADARCFQIEVLLRTGKTTAARDLAGALVKDQTLGRSRARGRALYYHGYASLVLREPLAAGKSLSQLAPFLDPDFGSHARYLLARVHHDEDERAEALADYEGVVADFAARKAKAAEALQQPDAFANNSTAKARLEALVNGPPSEHVGRALFFLGVLAYEGGRFADAQARFAEFVQSYPRSLLKGRARLYQAMCAVHGDQFAEAARILRPLAEEEPALAGLALLWLARAQVGMAAADDEDAQQRALRQALGTVRAALDKSRPAAGADAQAVRAAVRRKGEILLEMAALHHQAGEHKQAAALLAQVQEEHLLPERGEELLQRQASALNLAGDYIASDQLCRRFLQSYPRSLLLPEVLLRRAENAAFVARTRSGADTRLIDEAVRHYRQVVDKYAESPGVNQARYGLAMVYYRRGDWEKAHQVLSGIAAADCSGDLAAVPYVMADCLIRLAPTGADDAVTAGRLQEQLGTAAELLGAFVAERPDDPHAADALLRLGLCHKGLLAVTAADEERKKLVRAVRTAYERQLLEYPLNELQPYAAFERARALAQEGGDAVAEASNRLRSFQRGPLAQHAVAPLALLDLATLLRAQEGKAAEAAKIMARCRERYEKTLAQDPARAAWVPLLQYHHATALKEAGQHAEARALFDTLRTQQAKRPEGQESVLRSGQCLAEDGWQKIEKANQVLGTEGLPAPARAAAEQSIAEGWKLVRAAAAYHEAQAEQLKAATPPPELRARLLYEAAWLNRALGDQEVESARAKLRDSRREKLQQKAAKNTPEAQPVPMVEAPEVSVTDVPLQPAEQKARAHYQALIADSADLPLTVNARLELADLHCQRLDYAAAVALLTQAIDKEPPAELNDRLRLKLGACSVGQGQFKTALAQFEALAQTPEGTQIAQGHYRAAECLLRLNDVPAAIKHLQVFRDVEALHNVGGVSDIALLRLGHAQARLGQWEESRQTHELVLARFGDGPWSAEARTGIGWALQHQKNYKDAIEFYQQARGEATTETAARAQLLIGICLAQRNHLAEAEAAFQAMPGKYGYPELNALALVEAAHVATKLQKPSDAKKLLQQVAADYPGTVAAEMAKQRLQAPAARPPHELPKALALLTPNVEPAPVEALGQQQTDRVPLDSPTDAAARALLLARMASDRPVPAPWSRLVLPDPYEFRDAVPLPRLEESLPASTTRR